MIFSIRFGLASTAVALALAVASPVRATDVPTQPYGVQSGDVTADSAVIWGRADREARMIVEWCTDADFADATRVVGPAALETSDLTAKMVLEGLPAGQTIHYRVIFQDLADQTVESAPVEGAFKTAPTDRAPVRFVWSGDTAGQGWGINEAWGGMRIYETMRQVEPDFFIHSGDYIYADGPIKAEVALPDGTTWTNVTILEKEKVAETLDEFRGAYRYNMMDANVRAFNAAVPIFAQWDDHETLNNWYPQEVLADDRYTVKSVALLSARAKQAFAEYTPSRIDATTERIYRTLSYGPLLDVFFIDMRTYRGPNSANLQETASDATAFLGADQVAWLKRELKTSTATWKVIASDMPIGLVVRDGDHFENLANADDGAPKGRELEMADLLHFIKAEDIANVVWLTADVHYTAAHYYDPEKAAYPDFKGFWEFVSGPLNAGTFGPNDKDGTFGITVDYEKAPEGGMANLPPSAGLQFFGQIDIAADGMMSVQLKDLAGETLHTVTLTPES
ncbi:alkaline phosphatase [Roseospira marina]|uniref:Alkaline phosphatase n=1 Tax=Roseospira marina TaxID=140057 RepID=A0A5M6IBG3_9PROT|nr:alkaline phosphatase D family protein [Roseospira marina]KAA5605069.1 alkaline phosphatase [Roseospira marina]MBB4314814.1 alkaline phosphatase D [Roseospira marina]MBB5087814.1 alkaline phosphatase D [Roseospira marina]